MKTILRWGLSILVLALLVVQPVLAYNYPLSSKDIREAYFLGAGDPNKRNAFFGKYTKEYPIPKSGQYIWMIEFETPYVVIAERISQNVANYFAQDAEQDYLGKPAVCRVRVQIYYGWTGSQSPNTRLQTDYTIRLKQHDKEVPIKTRWTEDLVSNASAPVEIGLEFDIEYDAEKIDSSAPATVEVLAPDGQDVVETFDLGSLR